MMHERIKQVRKAIGEHGKTQDSFANYLGISKQNLSSYEIGRRTPSDAVIRLICDKLNVNEEWLRTGEGEMFVELTRKDKIMAWAAESLTTVTDDFRSRFVDVLDALNEDDWEVLANMAETMANRNKKKKD